MAKFNTAFMGRRRIWKKAKSLRLSICTWMNFRTSRPRTFPSCSQKPGNLAGLILANQFISQVRQNNIKEALFGNVGTLISFRLGIEDANDMEASSCRISTPRISAIYRITPQLSGRTLKENAHFPAISILSF